jgi:hypothetical protein
MPAGLDWCRGESSRMRGCGSKNRLVEWSMGEEKSREAPVVFPYLGFQRQ